MKNPEHLFPISLFSTTTKPNKNGDVGYQITPKKYRWTLQRTQQRQPISLPPFLTLFTVPLTNPPPRTSYSTIFHARFRDEKFQMQPLERVPDAF
ncbi:hypothetical protein C1H46_008501 [Malus baccata]|uniref:Uncharacterized protein n=1 Tax=Malus baccata TaxID=106549 RepID=A0A540N432_MALBA|nr:hypothetical protein C1H46_008501 [Malus baccata]